MEAREGMYMHFLKAWEKKTCKNTKLSLLNKSGGESQILKMRFEIG